MFNNRRLMFRDVRPVEAALILPFSLYGQVEAEMAKQMRHNQPPLDEYLYYRIAKQNLMDLL